MTQAKHISGYRLTSFIYYAIYTRPNSIQKIEQTYVENALLMKKELSTGVCKLFIFFIINDLKRKKMSVFWKKNNIHDGELHYLRESMR